jgi:hypothetical protein
MEELETENKEEFVWNSEFLHVADDMSSALSISYLTNTTVKELMLICEYYGLAKELRANKCNKAQIVDCIVRFETDATNMDLVHRRKNMWFYMNELRSDKFMKKFLLW